MKYLFDIIYFIAVKIILYKILYYLAILGLLILFVIFYALKLVFYIFWDPIFIYNTIKESKTIHKFVHNLIDK